MKIKLLLSSLLLLISVSFSVQADWQQAADEVETSIKLMLEKVSPYRGQLDADLAPLYLSLTEVTQGKVDYPYLSKIVMGKYYRRATDEQKAEFLSVFRRTLVKTYGKILVSFDIESFELQKNRSVSPKPDKQKVVVKVTSTKGQDYTLINYMVLKEGQWKLVNINLDGFNLRVTFKNQFASMAQQAKGDLSVAIQTWSDSMAIK
ncbi:MAG: ABC transporter substrate-binding protein [Oceanospirillaceae bacterium]|nr:ABC transporter substrate-binding protein [Oceanospirillaceae bacterium]